MFGGFHGDEPKSVDIAQRLISLLEESPAVGSAARWVIVPLVNPDGYERRKRRNVHGIDLNRNFPTDNWVLTSARSRMFSGDAPGSEPETHAVMNVIKRFKPQQIVTIHSIGDRRFCNNYDGPARRLATKMSRHNGYPVTGSIGYPTPGSFGTWAGIERRIPTITLELPTHHSAKRCWEDNRPAILAMA